MLFGSHPNSSIQTKFVATNTTRGRPPEENKHDTRSQIEIHHHWVWWQKHAGDTRAQRPRTNAQRDALPPSTTFHLVPIVGHCNGGGWGSTGCKYLWDDDRRRQGGKQPAQRVAFGEGIGWHFLLRPCRDTDVCFIVNAKTLAPSGIPCKREAD